MGTNTTPSIKEWYQENKEQYLKFVSEQDSVKNLRDVTKRSTKTVSSFSKTTLRTYLKNVTSNEINLRNLSRYLSYRSQVYLRLLIYNANMFELNARSVIPSYSLIEENDKEAILQSYENTLNVLDKMNLQYEMLKAMITCFREDVFYGCVYFDETSENPSSAMFIFPLDPDYCRIQGVYSTGDFAFAMDMSYFRSKQDILEYWGEPFQSMYKEYERSNVIWQTVPEQYAVCFKYKADDWEVITPVFSGLFNSIISLIDLEDIQAVKDEQEIYKLVYLELETLTGTNLPDDWKVSPDIAIEYFGRLMNEGLPDYSAGAIVPGKLNTISFDSDAANDVNKVEKATEATLNTSGGSQILNSSTISGTTAFLAAIKSDTEFAISSLLPQIQSWVNRFLGYYVDNPSKVKFFEVSAYTKDDFRKTLLENAQYGLPTKLALGCLSGFSEKETLSLNFLEEECLGITDKFRPLQSSYTTSSSTSEGGRPKSDPSELTDDGEASIEKTDNKNG